MRNYVLKPYTLNYLCHFLITKTQVTIEFLADFGYNGDVFNLLHCIHVIWCQVGTHGKNSVGRMSFVCSVLNAIDMV